MDPLTELITSPPAALTKAAADAEVKLSAALTKAEVENKKQIEVAVKKAVEESAKQPKTEGEA